MGCCAMHIGKVVAVDAPLWDGKRWSWEDLQTQWRTLKAGDIFLVSCRQGAKHRIIGAWNGGYWDHVAMVVHGFDRSSWQLEPEAEDPKAVDRANALHDGPQLLEATRAGVHIYNMLDRMTDPNAEKFHRETYSVRRLQRVERTPEFLQKIEKICQEVVGAPYSKWHEFALTAMRANPVDCNEELHCAELVALFYKRLGLIKEDIHSNNFQPGDFSSNGRKGQYEIDKLLRKSGSGAHLDSEELVFYQGQNKHHDQRRHESNQV